MGVVWRLVWRLSSGSGKRSEGASRGVNAVCCLAGLSSTLVWKLALQAGSAIRRAPVMPYRWVCSRIWFRDDVSYSLNLSVYHPLRVNLSIIRYMTFVNIFKNHPQRFFSELLIRLLYNLASEISPTETESNKRAFWGVFLIWGLVFFDNLISLQL